MTLNLYLVDPVKKERFSDPMIAIIEIVNVNKGPIEFDYSSFKSYNGV
jgi:hypothetical protein